MNDRRLALRATATIPILLNEIVAAKLPKLDERFRAISYICRAACRRSQSIAASEFGIPQNNLDAYQFISFH
jgi:hypothetical protein